jgi:Uma2 family endonuclease
MSLPVQHRRYTVEEYLELERQSEQKHEFRDGEIVAMAGASPAHVLIAANFLGEIREALKGKPCRAYGSDLKVASVSRGQITYPDGSIICGPSEFHPAAGVLRDVVTNPRVLIEVLSPSTEQYDRTMKFDLYREIASFEEYVLVAQQFPRVETYRRYPDGSWRFEPFVGIEASARLATVEVSVPLREIYAAVEFPPPPAPAES